MNMPLQVASDTQVQTTAMPTGKKKAGSEAADFLNIMATMLTSDQMAGQNPVPGVLTEASLGIIAQDSLGSISQQAERGFAILGEEALAEGLLEEEILKTNQGQLSNLENRDDPAVNLLAAEDLMSKEGSVTTPEAVSSETMVNSLIDKVSTPLAEKDVEAQEEEMPRGATGVSVESDNILLQSLASSLGQPISHEDAEPIDSKTVNPSKIEGESEILTKSGQGLGTTETDSIKEVDAETDDFVETGQHDEAKGFAEVLAKAPDQAKGNVDALRQEFHVSKQELPEELPRIIESQLRDSKGQEIKREVMIRLEPKDLGKLLVKLTEQEGVISVKIVAEHLETKKLVESGLLNLRQSLAEQGIRYGQLEVESSSQYLQQEQQDQQQQQQQHQQQQGQFQKSWENIFSDELWHNDRYSVENGVLQSQGSAKLIGSTGVDYVV